MPSWLIFDVGLRNPESARFSRMKAALALGFGLATGAIIIFASPAFAQRLPEAVDRLSKEPISVSGGPSGRSGSSFDIPDGRAAIIESEELVCLLELREAGANGRTYTFRTFHKPSGYEVTGEGEVFERYYRILQPGQSQSTRVVDRGSVLFVDAGFLKIRWSLGRWLYYDPKLVSVSSGSKAEYEAKVEPHRKKAP